MFTQQVTNQMNETLCKYLDEKEIKEIIFSMNKEALAAPNGFSVGFLQATWDLIKADLCSAIIEFFQGVMLPKGFSHTSIALIPKLPNPSLWS